MSEAARLTIYPIGYARSVLKTLDKAPKQFDLSGVVADNALREEGSKLLESFTKGKEERRRTIEQLLPRFLPSKKE